MVKIVEMAQNGQERFWIDKNGLKSQKMAQSMIRGASSDLVTEL